MIWRQGATGRPRAHATLDEMRGSALNWLRWWSAAVAHLGVELPEIFDARLGLMSRVGLAQALLFGASRLWLIVAGWRPAAAGRPLTPQASPSASQLT